MDHLIMSPPIAIGANQLSYRPEVGVSVGVWVGVSVGECEWWGMGIVI